MKIFKNKIKIRNINGIKRHQKLEKPPILQIGRINIVKISILPKVTYRLM